MAAVESPTKKAKTDEDVEMKAAAKAPEPPKELETDAPVDKLPRNKDKAWFNVSDTTLNLMQCTTGGFLKSLSDGGIQYFLAGARANVGMKSGRYMFEVKVVEHVYPANMDNKQLLKIGFSTSGSSLMAGEDLHSFCFDSLGHFVHDTKHTALTPKKMIGRDNVAALLLNLDEKSSNFNTVSLFIDGLRASQPQALPDSLKGKVLFPTVAFKNMAVHCNFGPDPLAPLPFKCRMLQDASVKDVSVTKETPAKEGKYELVVPVGLPDEGTFLWLDMFHQKNPGYTEISDRMILDWAEKSGIWRQGGYKGLRTCNDKPQKNFGVPILDDNSMSNMIKTIAPLQNRNYVVMEVKSNLLKDQRKELLDSFSNVTFKKVAQVQLGEPTLEFKRKVQELTLKQKQDASDSEFQRQKAQEKMKKEAAKKKKLVEIAQKKAEKERKKKADAFQKKLMADKKAAEAKKAAESGEAVKEDEKKEEEPEVLDADDDEDVEVVEKEEEEKDEPPPKVELTPEEKKSFFAKFATPDLNPVDMSGSFANFSAPEKEEGFDEMRYEWGRGAKCQEYLKNWILERKLTIRVENLQPGTWFHEKNKEWQSVSARWSQKQVDYNKSIIKKASEKNAKLAKKAAAALAAAKASADGETKDEPKPMEVEEDEKEEEPIDLAKVDVFGVRDVMDVGGGMPLFRDFAPEDWAMLALRFEMHLMGHAFRRDVADPERVGMHLDHIHFYYGKYFKKTISTQTFGVQSYREVCALVDDTVFVTKQDVLEPMQDGDMETFQIFVKLTEEARRHRQVLVDSGDESAKLKIVKKDAGWKDQKWSENNSGNKRDNQGNMQWTQGNDANKMWETMQKAFGGKGFGGGGGVGNWAQKANGGATGLNQGAKTGWSSGGWGK